MMGLKLLSLVKGTPWSYINSQMERFMRYFPNFVTLSHVSIVKHSLMIKARSYMSSNHQFYKMVILKQMLRIT